MNPEAENHLTFNYYFVGPANISSYAKTILLAYVLDSEAFTFLRTER